MAVPWYEWRNIRNRILTFARAVQGVSPYKVVLEPDKARCSSGYTNFSKRLIMVNPVMFEASPRVQYSLTKAVLCHEAGHRRFTAHAPLPPHVHVVSNILEDERIERLMEEEFAGVRGLLKGLAEEMLKEAQPLDPESDDPAQVLNFVLQLRWSLRSGVPVKGELSPANQGRWLQVEPLVAEAWRADASEVCDRNAREIIRILGLKEPDIPEWLKKLLEKLEAVEGERKPGDAAESAAPGDSGGREDAGEEEPFDGEPVPYEHGAGTGRHSLEPQPYLWLVEKVRPLVSRLVEELGLEPTPSTPEPVDRGGRLSVRQYLKDREHPFLLPEEDRPTPPTIAFRVVIDHSTSMNYGRRIQNAAEAAMLLHLAGLELALPHQVVITPSDIHIADLESGERGLALIAGMIPALTGWEDTGLAVSRHGEELAAGSEDIKLLLVIHDGMGNDYELLTKECRRLGSRVLILGLGIGMGEMEAGLLKEQFGPDKYIHCTSPDELPGKVGAVLRAVRGV